MKSAILQTGAAVLRHKATTVPKKDVTSPKIRGVIKRMKAALKPQENGVAIAAPQIGESLRIFIVAGKVFDDSEESATPVPSKKMPPDMVFINPELIRMSRGKKPMSEGCLSVRGVYGHVPRHEKATVRALDEQGTSFTYHGSGLLAQIFQHEVDHLQGVLFTDKAVSIDTPKDDE